MAEVDLRTIAARLEDDEKLALKYRALTTEEGRVEWVVRTDRLLDVSEDRQILYVDRDGTPVWVRVDEVVEVLLDG